MFWQILLIWSVVLFISSFTTLNLLISSSLVITVTVRLFPLGRFLSSCLYCWISASAPFCQMQMIWLWWMPVSWFETIACASRTMQASVRRVFPVVGICQFIQISNTFCT